MINVTGDAKLSTAKSANE